MRRGLAIALLLLVAVTAPTPEAEVAQAATLAAAPHGPVIGVASGDAEDPGSLTPTGNGRFTIDDRVYAGKSLVRSVSDEAARCLTGQFRSTEDWTLESPRMTGAHRGTATIRSEHGSVTLRLRGRMEFPFASGTWEVTRTSGGCADLQGEGTYTATYPDTGNGSTFRLSFDGQARG